MKNNIDIEYKTISVLSKIKVGDKVYPIHQWNINVVEKYNRSQDIKDLEKLKDFSLEF